MNRLAQHSQVASSRDDEESLRLRRKSFLWKSVYMFCGQKSYKKDKKLYKCGNETLCQTLERHCREKNDHVLLQYQVGDFSKLIAFEPRYHSRCHNNYTVEKKGSKPLSIYSDTLDELMTKVMPALDKGKALDMGSLHIKYQHILERHIPSDEAMQYTHHKLKIKLVVSTQVRLQDCLILFLDLKANITRYQG